MSCNRENVTWKGRDGKWNVGFFEFYETGDPSDEDWDYEWDVEYDFTQFNWASTGHPTQEAARNAWDGSNPGMWAINETPDAETDRFDKMVLDLRARTHR